MSEGIDMYAVDVRVGIKPCVTCAKATRCYACRKECRDWKLWRIRQIQVTEMDRRERYERNAVTGYEVERKRKVKERYYKRSK